MAKLTALTLVVALGTGGFFSGTTKTALADVMESVTQTATELQTTTEAPSETVNVSTETVTAGEKQDNDKLEKSEDSVREDEKTVNTENKDTVVKDEETVDEMTPTKYSSGTVSIHRTKSGEPLVHAAFEIYGLKDNGKAPESLEQFEGMKFYSHGLKYTDDNGDLTFMDLELDEDEWYFIKDLSNNKVVNVGSLPFYFDSKPTDGRIENNNGKYILYDIHFNVTDKKATITNFPKDEAETIMPLLFSVPEAKVQVGDSYNWSYKLYSSQTARSSVKIGSRVDFYYGSGNNRTQSSIFKLGDVYAACAQHNKSTTLKDTSVNESKYTGDLSQAEIENIMDTQHVLRTEADASREANAEVNELINQIHHYIATEISAPAGYEKVNDTRELELSGVASGDVTFTNAKSNVDTGVATYETYYYQELDIGKVNSENTDYILPGVQFQAYPSELGNGSTLTEIVYEDENGQMHSIKDENGIDTTLTDASDDYTFDKTNKEHRDFYGDWARKGASVVNTKTNANGVIRIGYVYKLRAVGNYSYVKDYNNLNSIQKAKADDLINNKGYYRDEASAYAAAKKEVTDQLENVNNKYKVWEYAEGIENPYDNKVYWDFARYILELGSDATISTLTRTITITKYAEINKNDAQKVYAKHNDIVASDNEFFIED